MVSLGWRSCSCSACCHRGSFPSLTSASPAGPDTVSGLQDAAHVGFMSMLDDIVQRREPHLERPQCAPARDGAGQRLVVGVQCGGGDAFSGVANPAVGFAADLAALAPP